MEGIQGQKYRVEMWDEGRWVATYWCNPKGVPADKAQAALHKARAERPTGRFRLFEVSGEEGSTTHAEPVYPARFMRNRARPALFVRQAVFGLPKQAVVVCACKQAAVHDVVKYDATKETGGW